MKKINMNLKSLQVSDFFYNGEEYFIPDYQRGYSWTEHQLEQWINDLKDISQIDSQYYLGRILLEESGNEFAIIDGQQRLTTILIFFRAAYEVEYKFDLAERIFRGYCNRFTLGENEQEFFEACIKNGENLKEKECKTESQHRILDAKKYFIKYFNNKEIDVTTLCNILLNACLAVIKTEGGKAATLMFQLENDRGVTLTNLEKLKASLMYKAMLVSASKDNGILGEISNTFNDIGKIANRIKESSNKVLVGFYRTYCSESGEFITGRNSRENAYSDYDLEKIQEFISGRESNKEIVEEISHFCGKLLQCFEAIEKLENSSLKLYKNTFKYLELMDYVLPFIFVEYDRKGEFDNKRLNKLLKTLANIVIRHEFANRHYPSSKDVNLTRKDRLGGLLRTFRNNFDIEYLESEIKEAFNTEKRKEWRIPRKQGSNAWPWSNKKYNELIEDINDYISDSPVLTRFFLFQYERELGNPNLDPKRSWTIEHISPQNKGDYEDGSGGYGEDDDTVYQIGNLCLLEQEVNSSASNNSFSNKLERYKKSKLKQVKEIMDYEFHDGRLKVPQWKNDSIEKRSDRIIEFINHYYSAPENSNLIDFSK